MEALLSSPTDSLSDSLASEEKPSSRSKKKSKKPKPAAPSAEQQLSRKRDWKSVHGRAKGTKKEINALETRYILEVLEPARISGKIVEWWYEGVRFKLADRTTYTPDFMVLMPDGMIEIHETKGFWEEDARVKIKVAASLFPFTFKALRPIAKKHGGGWTIEEF